MSAALALAWRFRWPLAVATVLLVGWLWHTGQVREARQEERAICEREKAASIRDAAHVDARALQTQIVNLQEDLRRSQQRAYAEQQGREDAEHEIAALEPELRRCRAPTDNDWRRLQ